MIVSWNWLREYVAVDVSADEIARRLAMAGLNHEGTEPVGDDLAIDLEVTSNRPDWLSHLGVARELAVLLDRPLRIPDPRPAHAGGDEARGGGGAASVRVDVACPELCPRYSARVIRGARIGPSPDWMVRRLATLGLKSVNNVVDITNYVLFECGQPLHAFDFAKLRGSRILVREPHPGEQIVAIDHKPYALEPGMCVIADAERAVAVGGIMGGYDTEVAPETRDLLIEAAEFAPLPIRAAVRKLKLRSPSSDRFERGIDAERLDWASRRCCELILDLAGGAMDALRADVSMPRPPRAPITLRFAQIGRILGIEVAPAEARRILGALGCAECAECGASRADAPERITTVPPSWRRDLTREIDLIEEVARIHGYERIPEDAAVPMTPSHRGDRDRLVTRTRHAVRAAGFDEAVTASVVPEEWASAFPPWSAAEPLRCETPLVKGADRLRRSLLPSLLAARSGNESGGNTRIDLFEIARVYLPRAGELPAEPLLLGMCGGRGFRDMKGVIEGLVESLHAPAPVAREFRDPLFRAGTGCELRLGDDRFAFVGEVSLATRRRFGLRRPAVAAELDMDVLQRHVVLVPRHQPVILFPAIQQDLNFILGESVRWAELDETVRRSAGAWLEEVAYRETYRDPQADGPDRKRILLSITVRSREGTLTGDQAAAIRDRIVAAVSERHAGRLLT
ncbi:MAG: phenylalanine--tRNA ligase subunit beta [Planctomycetes bacterium]|nr:phenylalanine--tRNA ligase subunit beta [Planctomycetota bacterium]